jgi:lipid-A-disaccharide synthase-like uncharacterized protein
MPNQRKFFRKIHMLLTSGGSHKTCESLPTVHTPGPVTRWLCFVAIHKEFRALVFIQIWIIIALFVNRFLQAVLWQTEETRQDVPELGWYAVFLGAGLLRFFFCLSSWSFSFSSCHWTKVMLRRLRIVFVSNSSSVEDTVLMIFSWILHWVLHIHRLFLERQLHVN